MIIAAKYCVIKTPTGKDTLFDDPKGVYKKWKTPKTKIEAEVYRFANRYCLAINSDYGGVRAI